MVEFTGIGCVPCHSALPFLKNLATEYEVKDFELVSIETWSQNVVAIKRYKCSNNLDYTLLVCFDCIKKSCNAELVPVFYNPDKELIIRNVVKGYDKETTNKEILDELI